MTSSLAATTDSLFLLSAAEKAFSTIRFASSSADPIPFSAVFLRISQPTKIPKVNPIKMATNPVITVATVVDIRAHLLLSKYIFTNKKTGFQNQSH